MFRKIAVFFAVAAAVAAAMDAQSSTQQNSTPKRTLVDSQNQKKNGQAAAPARDSGSAAYDALAASTENLNNIRDSNVRRLGEGCSPEAAARIGEIRTELGIKAAPARKDPAADAALLAVAGNWFTAPAESAPAVPHQKADEALASVLPGAPAKSAAAQDTASLQAEMNRLLASCTGTRPGEPR